MTKVILKVFHEYALILCPQSHPLCGLLLCPLFKEQRNWGPVDFVDFKRFSGSLFTPASTLSFLCRFVTAICGTASAATQTL